MRNETLQDTFINAITTEILSGNIPIGTKLKSERQLAIEHNISRSIVNRGLVHLAELGFIELIPRIGAIVTDYKKTGTLETMVAIMKFNGNKLNTNEIRSMLEMKGIIDAKTIELIGTSLTVHNINKLENILNEINYIDNVDLEINKRNIECIYNFFHELSVLSQNTIMPLMYSSFKQPIFVLWERFVELHGIEPLHETAQEILNALSNKDSSLAIKIINIAIVETICGEHKIYFE